MFSLRRSYKEKKTAEKERGSERDKNEAHTCEKKTVIKVRMHVTDERDRETNGQKKVLIDLK